MKYKSIFYAVGAVAVAVVLLMGCEAFLQMMVGPSFTDSRDGKTYKTVNVGDKTWMAKNLNFAAEGSKCYKDDPAYCEKYGRLYDWETALKACPAGFHIPSDDEWTELKVAVGGSGNKLKSTSGWDQGPGSMGRLTNGTDDYGFSALPGGRGYDDGSFDGAGDNGHWWSATESSERFARRMEMNYYSSTVDMEGKHKTNLLSVRCVQD